MDNVIRRWKWKSFEMVDSGKWINENYIFKSWCFLMKEGESGLNRMKMDKYGWKGIKVDYSIYIWMIQVGESLWKWMKATDWQFKTC